MGTGGDIGKRGKRRRENKGKDYIRKNREGKKAKTERKINISKTKNSENRRREEEKRRDGKGEVTINTRRGEEEEIDKWRE